MQFNDEVNVDVASWLLDVDVDTFPNWDAGFTFIKVRVLRENPNILGGERRDEVSE
jgi:hypothetical protein